MTIDTTKNKATKFVTFLVKTEEKKKHFLTEMADLNGMDFNDLVLNLINLGLKHSDLKQPEAE